MGTMNVADVLGVPAYGFAPPDPIGASGPNQGFVAPAYSGPPMGGSADPAPAFSVVGMILLLVAWRIVLELQGEG